MPPKRRPMTNRSTNRSTNLGFCVDRHSGSRRRSRSEVDLEACERAGMNILKAHQEDQDEKDSDATAALLITNEVFEESTKMLIGSISISGSGFGSGSGLTSPSTCSKEPASDSGGGDTVHKRAKMALLPLAATHTAAARTLPDGHFLTLLPGGAATKAGVIFGEWPKIKAVENASWADEMTALSAGCQLLAINSQPVTNLNFADAKRMLQAAAEACTGDKPFIELVWQRSEAAAERLPLSCAVEQWGLLRWQRRWLVYNGGVFSLFHTPSAPSARDSPHREWACADPLTSVTADADNPERLSVDNGVSIVHLKFEEPTDRDAFVAAFRCASCQSTGPAIDFDAKRFPFRLGKYWLGPMDPSKPIRNEETQGGFGYAMAGVNSETGERVCAKINYSIKFEGTVAQRKEVILQAMMRHENVVGIKDVLKEVPPEARDGKKKLVMIMELMSGGQLFSETLASGGLQCADNPKGMPESKIRGYFRQILLGLAYCHGRGIAHRDIKLENLLLCEDKTTVKIADFGLAKVSTGADKTILGTCKYMAPEMFEGAGGDGNDHRLCDIWAAGVCLFAMTECGFAFHVGGNGGAASGAEGRQWAGQNDIKLMNAIRSARYQLKPGRSAEYAAFLARLLCVDTSSRYTAVQALHDPWVIGEDWTVEHVDRMVSALDDERAAMATPSDYTEEEFMELVNAMVTSEDDAEDSF